MEKEPAAGMECSMGRPVVVLDRAVMNCQWWSSVGDVTRKVEWHDVAVASRSRDPDLNYAVCRRVDWRWRKLERFGESWWGHCGLRRLVRLGRLRSESLGWIPRA